MSEERGDFRSNPSNGRDCVKNPESQPRQWVDGSGPTYKTGAPVSDFILFLANAWKRKLRE